jgi:hypothetical protein
MTGKIVFIKPTLKNGRLRARVTVHTERAGYRQACLPERELAALVPRSLLVYNREDAPVTLLGIISSLLKRTAVGRKVKLHGPTGGEGGLVTFLTWRNVRFRRPPTNTPVSGARPHPDRRTTTA